MDPDPLISVIFTVPLLLFAVMTAAEVVLTLQSGNQLQGQLGGSEEGRSPKGNGQVSELSTLLFVASVVKHLCMLLMVGAVIVALPTLRTPASLVIGVACLWLILEVLQIAIKAFVWSRVQELSLGFGALLRIFAVLLTPLFALLNLLGKKIAGERFDLLSVSSLLTRDGLRSLLDAEEEETNIPESEKRMITSILDLDELVVREIMVPRIDMVALNVETDLKAALDVIIAAGHSRIPVYEVSSDRIIGMLYAKDLLSCFRNERFDIDIRSLLRPAYFVPMSKKVNSLFTEMQKQRVHIAIIVDEYGGTAGLVTIEDLIEEIVGDIQDEYDVNEDALAELIGSQVYLLNSRLDTDALSELLDITIEEDNADTIGGLIYVLAGRVPAQGETIEYAGWRFTVLSVDGHRIEQIRAEQIVEDVEAAHRHLLPADENAGTREKRDSALPFLISK